MTQAADNLEQRGNGCREVATWADLAAGIAALTEEQRRQPIQCCLAGFADPDVCFPGIGLGTVGQFEFDSMRSSYDNKWHADDLILLLDSNPFAVDGTIAYQYVPTYGQDGETFPHEQRP